MGFTCLKMAEEIWRNRVTHVLSTETEESIGLLLGDLEYSESGDATALIWGMSPPTRSNWQKGLLQTNPEQLAAASAKAEILTVITGRTTRVIGWYHSVPHFTVFPSPADVRKQAIYQLLDSGFIGLRFSCFNEDDYKAKRIQVVAFQSLDGKHRHSARPVAETSTVVNSYDTSMRLGSIMEDQGTSSDLSGWFAHDDVNNQSTGVGENRDVQDSFFIVEVTEPMDMHDSDLNMSGDEYVLKEIPLRLVPSPILLEPDVPLSLFTDRQRGFYDEEEEESHQVISQYMMSLRDVKVHPLYFIHGTSKYQASLCKLMDHCIRPGKDCLEALGDRITRLLNARSVAKTCSNAAEPIARLPPSCTN